MEAKQKCATCGKPFDGVFKLDQPRYCTAVCFNTGEDKRVEAAIALEKQERDDEEAAICAAENGLQFRTFVKQENENAQ